MNKPTMDVSRRKFLFALGTGGAGAVAAVLTKGAVAAQDAQPAAEPQKSKGYQVTEHVKQYYKTARM